MYLPSGQPVPKSNKLAVKNRTCMRCCVFESSCARNAHGRSGWRWIRKCVKANLMKTLNMCIECACAQKTTHALRPQHMPQKNERFFNNYFIIYDFLNFIMQNKCKKAPADNSKMFQKSEEPIVHRYSNITFEFLSAVVNPHRICRKYKEH